MKISIICPSDIALRRFLPALEQTQGLDFAGVGVYTAEERFGASPPADAGEAVARKRAQAEAMTARYGGVIYPSLSAAAAAPEADAVYIPLPPALHFRYARLALEAGKHVFLEKPAVTALEEAGELLRLAREKDLALHENYMFLFHSQLAALDEILRSGEIGDIRLYRLSFGFPRRAASDFRYRRSAGGGALLDAGGYCLQYAEHLLGPTARVTWSRLNYTPEFDVDLFGSATLENDAGQTVQAAFGMDQDYRCELEAWGSRGILRSGRVFTAPAGFTPRAVISRNGRPEERELPPDDAFLKSIQAFIRYTRDEDEKKAAWQRILRQAERMDSVQARTAASA